MPETSATRNYPRSLPFDPLRRSAAKRYRCAIGVLLACSLVAISASGMYMINFFRQQQTPDTAGSLAEPAATAALPAGIPPHAAHAPGATALKEEDPSKKAPAESADLVAARARSTRLLEMLGSSSAAQLYQSHLNLGLLADAVASQAYTEEQAHAVLNTLTGFLNLLARQLDNLDKEGLDVNDRKAVDNVRRLNSLLHVQADALVSFWETGDMEKEAEYLQARADAWEGMRTILEIEE